jgi:hypothetical protein
MNSREAISHQSGYDRKGEFRTQALDQSESSITTPDEPSDELVVIKPSRLQEEKEFESVSHQLQDSIEAQVKKTQIFHLEQDQNLRADREALKEMNLHYQTIINKLSARGAWKKVGLLAKEAAAAKRALETRQQQAGKVRISAHSQTRQQGEKEQVRLKQNLSQISSVKLNKSRGLSQRVGAMLPLIIDSQENDADRAVFLEKQDPSVNLLKKKTDVRYKNHKPSFFSSPAQKENDIQPLDKAEVEAFIKYVADGRQDEVEALLKIKPLLALTHSPVIDNRGKPFKCITAFQYAVFVLDAHMWEMMIPYFTEEQSRLAYEQMKELETYGTEHGKEQNWDKLTAEMKKYDDEHNKWTHDEHVQQLAAIGEEQEKLAQHVVSEYCWQDRPFSPVPNFEDGTKLPRGSYRENELKDKIQKKLLFYSSLYSYKYYVASRHINKEVKHDKKALLELTRIRRQQKAKLRQHLRIQCKPGSLPLR